MISKIQYITQDLPDRTHWELAEESCKAGVAWVQLRVKNKEYEEWKYIALKTQKVCVEYHATFIINDNVELAKEILADGVHLGKSDISPEEAHKILGDNFIIGGTANTFEDVVNLTNQGVDYIGLGPFRFTKTKEKLSPVLGLEGYTEILKKMKQHNITIPIIGIGGIKTEDLDSILSTGIYGIAVSSALTFAKDLQTTVSTFINSSFGADLID